MTTDPNLDSTAEFALPASLLIPANAKAENLPPTASTVGRGYRIGEPTGRSQFWCHNGPPTVAQAIGEVPRECSFRTPVKINDNGDAPRSFRKVPASNQLEFRL